jgi:hypothetical protein
VTYDGDAYLGNNLNVHGNITVSGIITGTVQGIASQANNVLHGVNKTADKLGQRAFWDILVEVDENGNSVYKDDKAYEAGFDTSLLINYQMQDAASAVRGYYPS